MLKRISYSFATAMLLIMPGAVTSSAFAADCQATPSGDSGSGGHWYFRLDRAHSRKCWYLAAPNSSGLPTRAPMTASSDLGTGSQANVSILASLFDSLRGTGQHADSGGGERARRPTNRMSSRSERLSYRRLVSSASAEQTDQTALSLSQEQREALFEQFVQWKRQTMFEELLQSKTRQISQAPE
jgi:hypothetical protein